MTEEQRAALIAALQEERRGYEARLSAAQEAGDDEAAATMNARLSAVDASLKEQGVETKRARSKASTEDGT